MRFVCNGQGYVAIHNAEGCRSIYRAHRSIVGEAALPHPAGRYASGVVRRYGRCAVTFLAAGKDSHSKQQQQQVVPHHYFHLGKCTRKNQKVKNQKNKRDAYARLLIPKLKFRNSILFNYFYHKINKHK